MLARHFTDETLLAFRDGELPLRKRWGVWSHLFVCWVCSARLADLQKQVYSLAQALCDPSYPGHNRIQRAKRLFEERREECKRSLRPQSAFVARRRTVLVLGAACLAVVSIIAWFGVHRRGSFVSRSEPVQVLSALAGAEVPNAPAGRAVHQRFRVEVVSTRPHTIERTGDLEIWADNSTDRYALRWFDGQGILRHALWRPDQRSEFVYDPDQRRVPRHNRRAAPVEISLAELARLDLGPESLEAGFMGWLQSRAWKPLHLARNLAIFASEPGCSLRMERATSGRLTLTARRSVHGKTVEVTVEWDEKPTRVALQTIAVESSEARLEIRLIARSSEILDSVTVRQAVFEPDIGLATLGRPRSMKVEEPRRMSILQPLEMPSARQGPNPQQLEDAEVRVRYALHNLGLCLSGSVRVGRAGRASILLEGILTTERERQELLAGLAGQPFLDFDLRTAESLDAERLNTRGPLEDELQMEERQAGPGALQQYLRRRMAPDQSRVWDWTDVAHQAVDLSGNIRRHSWALVRLAERYRETGPTGMSRGSIALIELMIRQHIDQIRHEVRQSRQLLDPLLEQAVPELKSHHSIDELPPFERWVDLIEFGARHAEDAERHTGDLFARAGLPDSDVESSARQLLDSWTCLERLIESAKTKRVAFPWHAPLAVAPASASHPRADRKE